MDALSNIVIETAQGKVKGVEEHDGIVVFRGIPYAAPPVGENRWKEAKPHEKWEGVLDCSSFGNSAPQNMMDEISQLIWTEEFQISNRTYSEDCLTLNLWTKAGLRDMAAVMFPAVPPARSMMARFFRRPGSFMSHLTTGKGRWRFLPGRNFRKSQKAGHPGIICFRMISRHFAG